VPDGIDQIEGVSRGVGDEPGLKDFEGRFIVTANMDGPSSKVVVLANGTNQEEDAIDTRKFTAIGVAFPDGTWDNVDCLDRVIIGWANEDEGCCATLQLEGPIGNSIALSVGDG
jgi:hypothetical protein